MIKPINERFENSILTGFLDKNHKSDFAYQPKLLVNSKTPPKKVLTTLIHELNNCEAFFISVAFLTTSGVATLMNSLSALEVKGVKGKILVSQYLNFTQPEALKRLLQFTNIELRIATKSNTHSKAYIFKTNQYFNLIIGSSNLTASALSTNKEWNLKVSALSQSGIVEKVLNEFDKDFSKGVPVTNQFITEYKIIYNKQFLLNKEIVSISLNQTQQDIEPNTMQEEALESLLKLRGEGKNKALLISATGTGKTYLSAFDAQKFKAKKLLFVVHRLTIAEKSMKAFQNIFKGQKSMGLYSGNQMDLNKDFIFSTVQTISKEGHLQKFQKDHFDYIIIDESHRSGASSYRRLIEYFEPAFLLGMTATPERTDGSDIFSLFDHNIAYEIRLNRAMEEDMLSQFHYYGVSDLIINENVHENTNDFHFLTVDDRVDKIIKTANFYGCDNGITRGLVFCSRNKEAKLLSQKFNDSGYKTIALDGENSERERVEAIRQLETDNLSEKIDYIFTVDIFNEGVDIPKVNQIIMIRPTDSAIIFIQQLGRGLRKVEGKGYLTIIDFIGNYKNNYLIPIALYGDTSYNKDSLRKLISGGSRMIPGASTINFDEITKERIFDSIDSANMQLMADLKKDYNLLKFKLGRSPMMIDFVEHGSRDPYLYVNYSKSYFNFVKKIDREVLTEFTQSALKVLELFSMEINNAKRIEESVLLMLLIEKGSLKRTDFSSYILENYRYVVSTSTIESAIRNLNFEFIREKRNKQLLTVKEIYHFHIVSYENDIFKLHSEFVSLLKQLDFKTYLLDSIAYATHSYNASFDFEKWSSGFTLYNKYSRKDVFRILNARENPVAQNVGGYLVSPDNSFCPIFVNYQKEDHISESTKYEDEFLNNKEFNWMSKSNRKLKSKDVQSILGNNGAIRLPLFIKKSNDEGLEFYYMGDMNPQPNQTVETTMANDIGKQVSVVKFRFNLQTPVSDSMFAYFSENRVSQTSVKTNTTIIEAKPIIRENQTTLEFSNKGDFKPNHIPLFDFYAAAGSFSEIQSGKNYTNVEVSNKYASDTYFACKIIGESMNKVIKNGSICLFKKYEGGSRNGKIVLVENFDQQDPDFNSAFTIKTYSSLKMVNEEGWEHLTITLRPNSFDTSYVPIVIDERNGQGMRVIGEFIKAID
jgi:superfamily II DNA or RNA helicase/HKD family nuclease/SOS-response transcriptional repressor LexA